MTSSRAARRCLVIVTMLGTAAIGVATAPLAVHAETPPAEAAAPAAAAARDDEAPRDLDLKPRPPREDADAPGVAPDHRSRPSPGGAGDDEDARPFWKSWLFWTVTGALAVTGAALVVYSAAGSGSQPDACPGPIAASLGCFGAGRGR